jgi:hypothetical protein
MEPGIRAGQAGINLNPAAKERSMINFQELELIDGVFRLILLGANQE